MLELELENWKSLSWRRYLKPRKWLRSPKESVQVKKKRGPTADPTFGPRAAEKTLWRQAGRREWALERAVGEKPKPAGKTLASRSQRDRPRDWKIDLMTWKRPWNSPAWKLMMTWQSSGCRGVAGGHIQPKWLLLLLLLGRLFYTVRGKGTIKLWVSRATQGRTPMWEASRKNHALLSREQYRIPVWLRVAQTLGVPSATVKPWEGPG